MLAGKGFHKVMEHYLTGMDLDKAFSLGIKEIESVPIRSIEFGKTGSLDKVIKDMTAGVNHYIDEMPFFGEIIATEDTITTNPELTFETKSGLKTKRAVLAIKAITDVVSRIDGKIHLHDHKLVSSFTNKEEENPSYIMQAMFNYLTQLDKRNETPIAFHFHEIKKTRNRDGSAQVETYTIEFDKHPEYLKTFTSIYVATIRILTNTDTQFLPNFADQLHGQEVWNDYTYEVMDFQMPKKVSHATAITTNVDRTYSKDYTQSFSDDSQLKDFEKIIAKMQEFGIPLKFVKKHVGANVTMFIYKPSRGVKMSKIESFTDDLAIALSAESVRIQAPIYGTNTVGIEVSNDEQKVLKLELTEPTKDLSILIGQDVYGEDVTLNLYKAPHMLVAGATGTGKSVFLNCVINSLIFNYKKNIELKLVDPKYTEFIDYEQEAEIYHDVPEIHELFEWLVELMQERYRILRDSKCRDIESYNSKSRKKMKYVITIIDELNDILMSKELKTTKIFGEEKVKVVKEKYSELIENDMIKLAQKARAVGIHLILATQRPSTDVLTGVLKANLPTRVGFRTATSTDSQVILDQKGCEKLLGNGDLLLMSPKFKNLVRLQGYYI